MLGWTVITAIFVNRIGIESLPFLFIGNAILVMCGTLVFSELIRFINKATLITVTLMIAAVILFSAATFILPRSELWFLITSLVGISLFLGQLNILIQLFIEDMFTPIESESAFPVIETSETIGGIVAGIVLTSLGSFIAPYKFLYLLIIISFLIIPTIAVFKRNCHNDLPNLNLHKKEKLREISKLQRIEEGWAEIKKTSFLQGVVVIILCQFIIFNLVEFQYTKAIQQKVYNAHEETIVMDTGIQLASTEYATTDESHATFIENSKLEKELAYTLGFFQMIISAFALLMQLFVASKIIKKIGIIQSILVHPLLMIANFSIMTMHFNISTAFISKTGFEMTRSIFQNAYLTSYYSLREEVREEIKEFMEGIITPLGAIIGTGFIFLFEYLLHDSQITLGINIAMLAVAFVMSYVIYNSQKEYTKVSSHALKLIDNTADKLNSIELLSQKGHRDSAKILMKALDSPIEKNIVKIKILEALGRIKDGDAIPMIIRYIDNPNPEVQMAAVNALYQYKQINKHLFQNAFAKFRIVTALKNLFERNAPIETKEVVIKILTRVNQQATVEYLIELLRIGGAELKRDCIKVMACFKDTSASHFIQGFLISNNVELRCSAMTAVWINDEHKQFIRKELKSLLKSSKDNHVINAMEVIGELRLMDFKSHILELSKSKRQAIEESALKVLMQLEDKDAIAPFINLLLNSKHNYKQIKTYMQSEHISEKFKKLINAKLNDKVSMHIHGILLQNNNKTLSEFSLYTLKELKHFYDLIGKDREVTHISEIIDKTLKPHMKRYKNKLNPQNT
ncbi:MAG: HEAT repeat domain-containing protein [Candidatus Peregrinibacteria bacterium]|nr:HEAT repeat domain-containing protein [Candidatus Peregrinibacteria bacterium]MDZ4244399.1 HEAT repeat domain-containing protein [Candidatus Gracilibacteria bacterium]